MRRNKERMIHEEWDMSGNGDYIRSEIDYDGY